MMPYNPLLGGQRFNPMIPQGMFPGGGTMPFNPYTSVLGTQKQNLAPLIAQILAMKKEVEAENQMRLEEKAATFDPKAAYRTSGAAIPHLMGLSAMQRYRDMEMRANARNEAARAAVDAVKAQQAAAPAPGSPEALAASGVTKEVIPTARGETTILKTPYGTASNAYIPPERKRFTIDGQTTRGGDLREFFQRAVNAGSPNASAIGLSPEPGYQGVPMTDDEAKKWAKVMKK